MNASFLLTQRPWQRAGRAQALAILLDIAPNYAMTIVTHLNRDQPYSLDDILVYTCLVEFRVADAQDLPFADGVFDAVITESVTALPEDKQRAADEYARVTRPGW